jgi:pantetheine-phosphate adenylyltransferase
MSRIAVFPGSFDPVTKGHESIVLRALPMFDKVIVALGSNTTKSYMFPHEKRKQWIEQTFTSHKNIEVVEYTSLTIDLCKKFGAQYILRGLRSAADFEYESNIAKMNRMMEPTIETVFMLTLPEYSGIHSTIVREIVKNGGNVSPFIPSGIELK